MELLIDEVVRGFMSFLWPMIRISALLLTAPLFSLGVVNLRIRVLLAGVLTVMIYPLHDWPVIDPFSAAGVFEVFNQVAIGAVMGLMLQVVVAAVTVAGQAISGTMGLMMASMVDPNMGNVPVLSQFLVLVTSLVFVSVGGHLLLVMGLLNSFATLPVGEPLQLADAVRALVAWSSVLFLGAMWLALPVLGVMLLINVGMGVVTRAAPSLNIFAVGFPALLLLGLLFVFLSLPGMVVRIQGLWLDGLLAMSELVGLNGGR